MVAKRGVRKPNRRDHQSVRVRRRGEADYATHEQGGERHTGSGNSGMLDLLFRRIVVAELGLGVKQQGVVRFSGFGCGWLTFDAGMGVATDSPYLLRLCRSWVFLKGTAVFFSGRTPKLGEEKKREGGVKKIG